MIFHFWDFTAGVAVGIVLMLTGLFSTARRLYRRGYVSHNGRLVHRSFISGQRVGDLGSTLTNGGGGGADVADIADTL